MNLNVHDHLFSFERLTQWPHIHHCITTRKSFGEADFNVSYHTGNEIQVTQNRESIRNYFQARSLTVPKQCHGITVARITESNHDTMPIDTDALITNVPGLAIGVLSADCVPLLFYDPVRRAIGAAHAGWKGTVAGIGSATIRQMQLGFDTNPKDIIVCIGPSISSKHFEVGEEVANRFLEIGLEDCISKPEGAKPHIDLWKANEQLLLRAGVLKTNIEHALVCTFENIQDLYSARAEGFETGRFGAFMMLE